MIEYPIIKNASGEKLDTWVEGDASSAKTIIMVHGFGTDKHEHGFFDAMSTAFTKAGFCVVRFDFSAYGKSEGNEVDGCYSKQAADLQAIIDYTKSSFPGEYFLFSQSMGTWVTALLSPTGFMRTVFVGMPNADTDIMVERFKDRFTKRPGAVFDENGISIYPRSSGEVQKIGPVFWAGMRSLDPIEKVTNFAQSTDLLNIHWYEDEILGTDHMEEYETIDKVKSLWLHGTHTVPTEEQRTELSKIAIGYFMGEELVEWVDEDEKSLGPIPISVANQSPKYLHREVVVLLADKNRRLFTGKRAATKHVAPNIWIPAAAGHLTYGDTLEATAHRELLEETGLDIKELKYLFREHVIMSNETQYCHWFLGNYDGSEIKLDPKESSEYMWVTEAGFDEFCRTHDMPDRSSSAFRRYWAGEWD
ncbi:MAG: alpha/beta fold hydrolase [bacterium]